MDEFEGYSFYESLDDKRKREFEEGEMMIHLVIDKRGKNTEYKAFEDFDDAWGSIDDWQDLDCDEDNFYKDEDDITVYHYRKDKKVIIKTLFMQLKCD